MSNIAPTHLCLIERTRLGEKESVCAATLEKISALVIALIGIAFLASGLYLLLGRIGTIPALTGGSGLLAGGVLALTSVLFCTNRIE